MSFTAGTSFLKQGENKKEWYIIDASGLVLGRLAAEVAKVLRGKHKPEFTPHIDSGDHVVIINAKDVCLTGANKGEEKFYWHTNHPGGIKERSKKDLLAGKHPERVLLNAIKRMMPKESPLARSQLSKNLKVYSGSEHPHAAQNPKVLDVASKNVKNKK